MCITKLASSGLAPSSIPLSVPYHIYTNNAFSSFYPLKHTYMHTYIPIHTYIPLPLMSYVVSPGGAQRWRAWASSSGPRRRPSWGSLAWGTRSVRRRGGARNRRDNIPFRAGGGYQSLSLIDFPILYVCSYVFETHYTNPRLRTPIFKSFKPTLHTQARASAPCLETDRWASA